MHQNELCYDKISFAAALVQGCFKNEKYFLQKPSTSQQTKSVEPSERRMHRNVPERVELRLRRPQDGQHRLRKCLPWHDERLLHQVGRIELI